jgi:hypothetical protein
MGVQGLTSKVRSSYRQGRELISEALDNKPKSLERQNVSKLLTLSSAVCRQSLFSKLIQSPLSNILFDLAIPNFSVKFEKPSTERGKFRRRQGFNLLLDIFNFAH